MNEKVEVEFPLLQDVIYLDHAGATLYSKSQLESYLQDLSSHIYGNPHSRSQSSQLTSEVIENVRERILHHFGTTSETHSVIFTANCTAAIKLVAETFKWNRNFEGEIIQRDSRLNDVKSTLLYLDNSHTSIVGMRGYALKNGADFDCISENKVENSLKNFGQVKQGTIDINAPNCLFAYPAQCNFSGRKFPQNWANHLKRNVTANFVGHFGRWCILLDAASYVMTSHLDLSQCNADFVSISFYKMFGFPTGIGALIIRNESVGFLNKAFFGGGTVQVYLSSEDFHVPKFRIHEWFEDGTLPFLDIISLRHGFDTLQGLAGGINQISQHTFKLARYVHHELASYYHNNSRPVAKLYHDNDFENIQIQGAIVNFNLLRKNGDYVGYSEVDKLACLYNIQLRTGCFCNTGACQKFLRLKSDKVKKNFEAGHSCGDDKDLIDGQPTGSVRISFGYMSRWKDAKKFLLFIRECFMSNDISAKISETQIGSHLSTINKDNVTMLDNCDGLKSEVLIEEMKNVCNHQVDSTNLEPVESGIRQCRPDDLIDTNTASSRFIYKMFLYPVKSCAAMEIDEWEIGSTGFLYDREWMIVNDSGVALTQKRNTKLCLIKPYINLENNTLTLNVKGKSSFALSLEMGEISPSTSFEKTDPLLCQARVCMNRVEGIDCGQAVSDWLSDILGHHCKLIRQNHRYKRLTKSEAVEVSFVNESQFLLLNKASASYLLQSIQERDHSTNKGQYTDSGMDLDNLISRFRANFVISGEKVFEEDAWKEVFINKLKFKVVGPCTRCQMVCVDQETGVRGKEPLKILSSLRGKRMSFGVYLQLQENQQHEGSLSTSDPVSVVTTERVKNQQVL